MNLYQLDLNLLVLFDALMRHKSVSLAAQEVCLSQSAFSHGLTRLRDRLDDQLFIRINNVMEPTPRAIELAQHISTAFPIIENGLKQSTPFDALTSNIVIKLIATDYTEYCLLPKLMAHFKSVAPNIKLTVLPASQLSPKEQLTSNEIDFALGFSHEQFNSSTIEHYTWLNDGYCTLVRKKHPKIKSKLTFEDFISLPHILIAPWGEKQGVVDEALDALKLKRDVAIQLPSLLVAPHIVKETNAILTLPKLIATEFYQQNQCNIFPTPIKIPDYQLNLYWHKINANKAVTKWFVEQVQLLFTDNSGV